MMERVCDLMQGAPVTASPDESVRRAGARMESLRLDCLPVLDRDGRLVGLLTAWDVRKAHPNRLVADAMSPRYLTVAAEASIWVARDLFAQAQVEHLPVMDGQRLIGLLSRSHLEVAVARLTDALTGLPTAAYLRHAIDTLWQAGREVSLIFVDINQFGPMNKRLGHAAGDRALLLLAHLLAQHLDPAADVLCRYGGDEFAVASTRSGTEAQLLARRLVQEVARAPREDGLSLTISAGIARGRRRPGRAGEPGAVDELINLASRASTEAKRSSSGVLLVELAAGA